MYKLIATLCLMLLVGCGGNVKSVTCTGIDWNDLGYTTATKGKSVRTFDAYRDQCGNNLEEGAMDSYIEGYTKGVIEYCTYDNGYILGKQNKPIGASCPIEVRSLFEKGYAQGLRELKENLAELDRERENTEREEMIKASKSQQPTTPNDTPGY